MSALFDTHQGKATELLVGGLSTADAARELGCAERTIKGWLSRGREAPEGKYGAFAAKVDAAREARELPPRDELPMDLDELRLVVSSAARAGNVQAMRLLSELLLRDAGEGAQGDALTALDELAGRRQRRA